MAHRFSYRKIDRTHNIIAVMYDGFCVAIVTQLDRGWIWQSHNPTLEGSDSNSRIPALTVAFPEVCGPTIYPDHTKAREAAKSFIRAELGNNWRMTCAFCGTRVDDFCPFCNRILPRNATDRYAQNCELLDRDLADLELELTKHEHNQAHQLGDCNPVATIQAVYDQLGEGIAIFLKDPTTYQLLVIVRYDKGMHLVRSLIATLRAALPAYQAQQAVSPDNYDHPLEVIEVACAASAAVRSLSFAPQFSIRKNGKCC